MSDKAEVMMEMACSTPVKEDEKMAEDKDIDAVAEGEDEKKTEDDGADGGDEEEEDQEVTPKRRKTLTEKRLNRLSSGMEMRGMMTESYNCKECSASFSRKSKLDYHIANSHPKEEPVPIAEPSPKRGRKPKTPKKVEKPPKTPPKTSSKTPSKPPPKVSADTCIKKIESALIIKNSVQQVLQKHQAMSVLKLNKTPKVTNISNEKVKYNWGYYCTACDMYFANMFAQQFHCLHGQAKFRCEACCICFKLRKNFMSHVQMVHGVDIPEEVLARMRPRSEIRAKQGADAEKSVERGAQKHQETEVVDLTRDESKENSEKKEADTHGHENSTNKDAKPKSEADKLEAGKDLSNANENAGVKTSVNGENQTGDQMNDKAALRHGEKPVIEAGGKDQLQKKEEATNIVIIADSPAKNRIRDGPMKPKMVQDLKQTESGGNSSADETDKKEEGRVYLTTVRMGNTYVTLPSGEKWMIECLRCHQAFFKMEDASVHMKQRHGSQFSCPHCQYSSTLFSQCDYEIHRLRTHSFPCAQCRQSFILECQRDMHEQKIHNYSRALMRRKPQPAESVQAKSVSGTNSDVRVSVKKTVIIPSPGVSTANRAIASKDRFPVSSRAQRTPYVCLMCDRDCYTRDALEHHKKTFHSAVYRPNNKVIHPISKNTIVYKQPGVKMQGPLKSSSAPVSRILEEMRHAPRGKLPLSANYMPQSTATAMKNPYLEPNKLPQAYISRIKVDLPEANKLVDDIRNELLKGPSNFAMPNYAKPSKFNKDMVTNPNVVKLSREVAYKLYFDLQGPCNESDKMNYKEADKIKYKIPMGCHSQKLKDVPLFPTLDDMMFRTQNYTIPAVNTVSPIEIFGRFEGDLSMPDSIKFSAELENVMFGHFTKTMRALTMIYSSRRVAVSEGFWRLQTKALIAILKDVEDQRKKEIAERAKAASTAANAAAAAAASARPLPIKLNKLQQGHSSGSCLAVVDLVQQTGPRVLIPNGSLSNHPPPPMIQLVQGQARDNSIHSQSVSKNNDLPKDVSSKMNPVAGASSKPVATLVQDGQTSDQTKSSLNKKTTSADNSLSHVPTLSALAKKAAGKGETLEDEGDEEKVEAEKEEIEKEKKKEEVLVNGNASPPPGDNNGTALNGIQNGSSGGASPLHGSSSSDIKTAQSTTGESTQKSSKASSVSVDTTPAPPVEPVNNVPNGTMYAPVNTPTTQTLGRSGGGTLGGNQVGSINVNGSVGYVGGIPVRLGQLGNGSLGLSGLGGNVIHIKSGVGANNGGSIRPGGGGFLTSGGGNGGLVLTLAPNNVQLMSVPKLAYSVGAVSAVASVQNIPPVQAPGKPITMPVSKPVIAKPSTRVLPDKVTQFIKSHFINIKPKSAESHFIPIQVESLPSDSAAQQPSNKPKAVSDLVAAALQKVAAKEQVQESVLETIPEDPVLTRVLKLTNTLKQLYSSNVLPEDLCKKIIPLCDKIALSSTTVEDKETLSETLSSILNAESGDALRLLDDTIDGHSNNNTIPAPDAAGEIPAGIEKFLSSLAQRIKYIQNRLTTRSLDPVTLVEIVPLCQDICDPKLPLKRKVECIKETEQKIRTYEEEAVSRSQTATPVDIAALPDELRVEEEATVHFKLQLGDGSYVMVDTESVEQAYKALASSNSLTVRLKRMSDHDIEESKRTLQRKKVKYNRKEAAANSNAARQSKGEKGRRDGKKPTPKSSSGEEKSKESHSSKRKASDNNTCSTKKKK